MADNKIFAGPRLRRIRRSLDLTQTAMAEALSISPSYLNLIERNQRPLTVQLLMKLASVYDLDIAALQGETTGTLAQLKTVFSDPLLAGELPGDQELVEVADAAPNAAIGLVKLHRAYTEQAERLSDLTALLARAGHDTPTAGKRLPLEEVRDGFSHAPFYFDAIDAAAEAFHRALSPGDDLSSALKAWLKRERGIAVRILPPGAMVSLSRRFDRHTMRLFISSRFSPYDQCREIAVEVAMLAFKDVIGATVDRLSLTTEEAKRLARFELARYAALAMMMPYTAFIEAARRDRYDLSLLCGRFSVTFEQAATRLVSLRREGNAGLALFAMECDPAGNILRRFGAHGFPISSFRGECPKLALHDAFCQPGRILSERAALPSGEEFLLIARTIEGPEPAFNERPRRTALLLGMPWADSQATVYGSGMGETAIATPIGPICRLCERAGCLSRAAPPVTRPLGLDEMVAGFSVFDFQ